MNEPHWQSTALSILQSAGWDLFHQDDERWVATHHATGKMATIWIDWEKTVKWRNLIQGSIEEFEVCRELAASDVLDCLADHFDHDRWLEKIEELTKP